MKTCPTHNKELRQGKNGSWYCATKMPDGGWCPHKEYDNAPQASQPSQAATSPDATKLLFNTLETIIKELRTVQIKLAELKEIALQDKEPVPTPRPNVDLPF